MERQRSAWFGRCLAGTCGVAVLVAWAGIGSAGEAWHDRAPPGEGTCGAPGQAPCPLQAWMRANLAGPLASTNFDAVASGLDRVAAANPSVTWASWSSIAKGGADAARKHDLDAVRAACKACHAEWREKYRESFRTRPAPR